MIKSIHGTLFLSFCLFLVSSFMEGQPDTIDIINSAIFGGVLSGIGIGIIIKYNATTGGTDLIATLLNKYIKNISISLWIFILDTAIILIGLVVFGVNRAMYAIMAVFIASKIISLFQIGFSFNKTIMIISDEFDAIGKKLVQDYGYGVTSLNGKGVYLQKEKDVLLCVVPAKNVHKVIAIIHSVDKNAFIMLNETREVMGNGFKSL